jgi:hypothetical protein
MHAMGLMGLSVGKEMKIDGLESKFGTRYIYFLCFL